jgi:nitric oxide dioxygenase
VIAAWTEAHEFLAQILMRREQELYAQGTEGPRGWLGWREFVVDRMAPESEVITSFYLRPRDGGPIMGFKPGQYLTFQLDIPGQGQVVRNYSVSCAPGQDYYRISVKREGPPDDAPDAPAGVASNYLHDQGGPGTLVRVSAPAGDFFLDAQDSRPLVLLSGGVGLTPILSMLDTLTARGSQRDIWYVHGALSGRHHAMKQHVKEVVAAHPAVRSVVFYEFPTPEDVQSHDYDEPGRITMDWLKQTVPMAGRLLFLRAEGVHADAGHRAAGPGRP